jgi:hypothetical protein
MALLTPVIALWGWNDHRKKIINDASPETAPKGYLCCTPDWGRLYEQ